MKPFRIALVAALGALLTLERCPADTVLLKDGTEHEGEIVRQTTDALSLRVRLGSLSGTIQFPNQEIEKIEFKALRADEVMAAADALLREAVAAEAEKNAPRAAEAWLKAAQHYARHPGYASQTRVAYRKVVQHDPNHKAAREALGQVLTKEGWADAQKLRKPAPPAVADEGPRPAPDGGAGPDAKAQPARDDLALALKRDEALVRRLLDEQAGRNQAEIAERQQVLPPDVPVYSGYASRGSYFGPGYPYPLADSGGGIGYNNYYGGGGYGGYRGGYGYSPACSPYGSGFSLGFRGGRGSFRYSGNYFSGFGFGSGGGYRGF